MSTPLTTKLRRIRATHCHNLHVQYMNYNQKEHWTDRHLADAGHPASALYNACRRYFDTLSVASNSKARMVAMTVDPQGEPLSQLQMTMPSLHLPWDPCKEINGEYFGRIYPSHERWEDYMHAIIATGFDCIPPKLTGGDFHLQVHRSNAQGKMTDAHRAEEELFTKLVVALTALSKQNKDVRISYGTSKETCCLRVCFDELKTIKTFHAIRRIFKQAFKGHFLPKRRPEQDAKDSFVPLAQRPIMSGNVSKVTDNGSCILVPLIPFNKQADAIQLEIVNTLVAKVREGLPLTTAEPYFKRHLKSGTYHKLIRELQN